MSDKLFGIHVQALTLRAQRIEQLAANIANGVRYMASLQFLECVHFDS